MTDPAADARLDTASDVCPYLALKLAQAMFGKGTDRLEPAERQRVEKAAARQFAIERRILASPEAACVTVPDASIRDAFKVVRSRYESDDAFETALARAGLDRDGLAAGLARGLRVDAVLDRVSRAVAVSDAEIETFHRLRRERFARPERRALRHILVTVNDALRSNGREAARRAIDAILRQLRASPERFEALALRHSECATALDGGRLGTVGRGQLYPELEREAFALEPGGISQVIESPMGFHILQCVAVQPAGELTLEQARGRIRSHLAESKRKAVQREWIASLFGKAA
jgi:nitrogen fixation protein NifM